MVLAGDPPQGFKLPVGGYYVRGASGGPHDGPVSDASHNPSHEGPMRGANQLPKNNKSGVTSFLGEKKKKGDCRFRDNQYAKAVGDTKLTAYYGWPGADTGSLRLWQ